MLKQRVITAIVMLAILLPALFYKTAVPFNVVTLVLIAAGAWEWGRLNGCQQTASLALGAVSLVLCGLSWYGGLLDKPLALLWTVAGASWVLAAALLLRHGIPGWARIPRIIRLTSGMAALWLAWLAIVQARVLGINFLLSVLLLVWVADIFAYFAGRRFGGRFSKRKLAPGISPGKSWEGVWGGMAGVLLLALVWVYADGYGQQSAETGSVTTPAASGSSLYSQVYSRHGALVMLIAVLFMAAMSVAGDLVESLIKRSAGAKDSSNLLPGHGGVLDRVDALLPTLPLAMMLVSL
ncbi:MAG: phosphatidate cytidylyltransferase [Polaromonas sp.]|jgi:phosphatidate cytidylyltransferase|nr:phosphatidate cytidylyltransferase [Polaromonas sp.]